MGKILLINECGPLCPHCLRHNLLFEGTIHGTTQLACLRLKGNAPYDGTYLSGRIWTSRGINKQRMFETSCFLKAYE
jgi:hypothetical protein